MIYSPNEGLEGLSGTTSQIVGSVAPVVGTGIATTIGLASWAIPVVGPAISAVTFGITALLNSKKNQQKVASTNIVNEVEPHMKENLRAWKESDKTQSEQKQALVNFNNLWELVVSNLNKPELGTPGQNGINDRKRGGKWDWFSYYYDPIANDPDVKPDKVGYLPSSLVNQETGQIDWMTLGLILGLGLLVFSK